MKERKRKMLIADILVLGGSFLIFGVPLYFLVINSFKNQKEARQLSISLPKSFAIVENYKEAFSNQHYMIVRAFFNSVIITLYTVLSALLLLYEENPVYPCKNFLLKKSFSILSSQNQKHKYHFS